VAPLVRFKSATTGLEDAEIPQAKLHAFAITGPATGGALFGR
jgi:hypothetical protein